MKEGCKNAECLDAAFSFLPSLFSAQSPLCGTDESGHCLNTTRPCEDVLLFCSLCRSSQSSRASAVRLCLSLQLVETQLPTHRKTSGFPSAPLLCNPLHLASKVVGQTFPLDSLKMPSMKHKSFRLYIPSPAFGKDQNHIGPCFLETIPSCAFAFFAVLSLIPAPRIIAITACCGIGPSARTEDSASLAACICVSGRPISANTFPRTSSAVLGSSFSHSTFPSLTEKVTACPVGPTLHLT